jgi:hypothetical protein
VCELAIALYLLVVTICKCLINRIPNPNLPPFIVEVEVEVNLRLTVSQSVSQSLKHDNIYQSESESELLYD